MVKPTIVCVPGAWFGPEIYDDTVKTLRAHGYPVLGLPLHSVSASPPDRDFSNDVKSIRDCLTQLIEGEERKVVLVSQSYAGMPAAEAPIGLGRKERKRKGLPGGVIRLVFIMAFVMPEGFQPTGTGAQFPDWMKLDLEKGIVNVTPEDAKDIFFNNLSPDEAEKWASKIRPQSLGVYDSTVTYAGWRCIPSTYVVGTADRTTFTPEFVDMMINTARSIEPSALDVIEKCNGGHCLMISQPDWLAGVLRRAAGEEL